MYSNNNSSRVTIVRKTNDPSHNFNNSRILQRDQERFSHAGTTSRIIIPHREDYKYSVRQNMQSSINNSSNQFVQPNYRPFNDNREPIIKEEKQSIGSVSYHSIDNKYGLVVRKVERQSHLGFQSEIFPNKQDIERMEPKSLQHNKLKSDYNNPNITNEYFENEYSKNKIQSKRIVFKHPFNPNQNNPETQYSFQPTYLESKEHKIKTAPTFLKASKKDNEDSKEPYNSVQESISIETAIGNYKGDIINNKLNGKGQLFDLNGHVIYDGWFKDNMFDGYGVLFNLSSIEFQSDDYEYLQRIDYECYYSDMDMVKSNWQKYEGIFKDDKKHKIGFWHLNNGDLFFGEFSDDKANGYGIYTMANGSKIVGSWKNNKFIDII